MFLQKQKCIKERSLRACSYSKHLINVTLSNNRDRPFVPPHLERFQVCTYRTAVVYSNKAQLIELHTRKIDLILILETLYILVRSVWSCVHSERSTRMSFTLLRCSVRSVLFSVHPEYSTHMCSTPLFMLVPNICFSVHFTYHFLYQQFELLSSYQMACYLRKLAGVSPDPIVTAMTAVRLSKKAVC